ncbi:MAG: alpha-amylase family glycosyl hydrolase [Chloroflexota bacterium]
MPTAMTQRAPSPRPGMGAIPSSGGTTFRVWAPHAESVFVTGSFTDWTLPGTPLARDGDGTGGTWSVDLPGVQPGAEYRFTIRTASGDISRLDPYARQVTNSVGNAVVYDPQAFDWGGVESTMPDRDDIVIYELHIGTFTATDDRRGDFDRAIRRLPYLRDLGITAVQVMPPFEFAGGISWGYNPAHLFAIESGYGGPDAFKRFIKAAHEHGIAVIVDVVYNHLGPSDLDLWRFDGWSENEGGGIYVYNDDRATTPWGDTRPDFGRGEVRTFLRDSAMTWLEEFRCDGLRFDSTVHIRSVDGLGDNPASALPDGWSFMAWLNDEIRERQPWKLTIAEDLQDDPALVAPTGQGGAGFGAQWDAGFVHRIRAAITTPDDGERDMTAVVEAIAGKGRGPAHTRVIYTESHDEVANGRVRVPEAIAPGDAAGWWATKRATLGSAIVLTAPGIPMLFQGQELLADRWFDDTVAFDWSRASEHEGILRLHRDLIRLRRGGGGVTRGLRGPNVAILRADDEAKILVMHRWADGGPGDDVIVLANFADRRVDDLRIGVPAAGTWRVRFNSDAPVYAPDFGGHEALDTDSDTIRADGREHSALVSVGPYSVIVLSQDP